MTARFTHAWYLLIASAVLALLVAACGSDDDPPAGPGGASGSAGSAGSAGSSGASGGSSTGGSASGGTSAGGTTGGSSGSAGAGGVPDAGPDGPSLDAGADAEGGTAPAFRIEISPAGSILRPGENATFTARAVKLDGSPQAGNVTWQINGAAATLAPLADNQVRVTAGAAIDSAQVVAVLDGVQSAPITISVAEPVPGARLLADDEVLSDTTPIDSLQDGLLGSRLRVVLAGQAPPPGQILIGRAKRVAGKVVSSTPAAVGHDVVFEIVPVGDLFSALRIEQTYDLDHVVPSYPGITPVRTTVAANGATTHHFTVDVPATTAPAPNDGLLAAPGDFKLGPFYCSASAGIAPSLSASQINFSITPNLNWSVNLVVGAASASFKVLGQGSIDATVQGPLRLNSALNGGLKCNAPFVEHPIVLPPPLVLFVVPTFVGGARLSTDGQILVNTMELMIDAQASQPVKLGVEIASNGTVTNLSELDVSQLDYTLKPELRNTTLNSPVRIEAHMSGGLYAQATFTNAIYFAYRRFNDQYPYLSLLDLESGLRAELKLGTIADQVHDAAYNTGYNIKFRTRFGLGADANAIIGYVSRLLALGAGLIPDFTHEKLLFSQPIGGSLTWLNRYQAGNQVHFRVLLDPEYVKPELLDYYNVRRVEIWRKQPGGGADLLIGRDALDGEEEFNLVWTADQGGIAKDNVYAFVEPVFGEGFTLKVGPVLGWNGIQQVGAGNNQNGRALALDNDGRVAVVGYTLDELTSVPSAGGADAMWLRFNPVGSITHGNLIGGAGDDIPVDMERAPDGHYYVTGYSFGGDFAGTGAPGSIYAWLAKLNAEGTPVWRKSWASQTWRNGAEQERGDSLALGPNGEIYVASLAGTGIYGNALAQQCPDVFNEFNSTDCGDITVSHFDVHGNLIWRHTDERKGMQDVARIAVDSGGNIVVSAHTYGDIEADKVPAHEDATLPANDPTRKKNGIGFWTIDQSNGEVRSRTLIKVENKNAMPRGIACDDAGNAVIVGETDGSFDGANLGARDAFVVSVSALGSMNWTQMIATPGDDVAGNVRNVNGDLLIVGITTGTLFATPAGGNDSFVVRLSAAGGGHVWGTQFGGIANDNPFDAALDRFGNVFVCGSTSGKLSSQIAQGFGGLDVFVAKFGPGDLTPQ